MDPRFSITRQAPVNPWSSLINILRDYGKKMPKSRNIAMGRDIVEKANLNELPAVLGWKLPSRHSNRLLHGLEFDKSLA
jgi:hypothetical protein